MAALPETKFARVGDLDIAYQVLGSGPLDLIMVPGWLSNLELMWELPEFARFLERLANFSRLIIFDKRGSGLSDRVAGFSAPEDRAHDIGAVADAVGSERFALVGWIDAAAIAALYAAAHPGRVSALVLGMFSAKSTADETYPWGVDRDTIAAVAAAIAEHWGEGLTAFVTAPSMSGDERFLAWFRRWERTSATPRVAMMTLQMALELDIRSVLPTIQVPTLVLHRAEVDFINPEAARWAAAQIPQARYVELPGRDPFPLVGDADAVLDEIEVFLTGERGTPDVDRRLATLVFIDVVGSTEHVGRLGDRSWSLLLDTHRAEVRRLVKRFDGREIDTAGDGFFATFDGAARAIRCISAISDAMPPLGLEIRAGVHAGEIEQRGGSVTGMAVHIAARVATVAHAGEILVTRTVKDLVIGSGIRFVERGRHQLKGVADEWDLFAVASVQ